MTLIFSIILSLTLIANSKNALTERWFDINPKAINHPVQAKIWSDFKAKKYDNYVIAAGRRSFKTERFSKRLLVRECMYNDNKHYYVGAPTRSQAKEIFWADLKQLSPKSHVKSIKEVELKIEYNTGCVLRVIGLKEFKRIQGQLMHGIVISEYQDCDPAVYNESIEPMINDTHGFCIKEGRPLGKNHFYDDFNKGKNGEKGWCSYHWTAEDILSEEQIARAKRNLAKEDYNREYLASFETGSSNPYYAYSPNNNLAHKYTPDLPLIIACDFNATVKPMSWVLGQRVKNETYWFKVHSYQYTNTLTMCGIIRDSLKDIEPKVIYFYGDYAGTQNKSNSSYTDWEIIENEFRNFCKIELRIKPCTSVRDTVGATNAQLCNANNETRQYIDYENCLPLALDWEKCEWKDNSKELDDSDDLRGHCSRAVDYYNDYEYPIYGQNTSEYTRL